MDEEIKITKSDIVGFIVFMLIIILTPITIYLYFIYEPSDDTWLETKNQYTYYIDMDSHSKLNEYLINDIDVRESFKAWSDLNDISFTEIDEISDNYQLTWFSKMLGIEPQLPNIIIFFSQTPNTYGTIGETRCYNTYCTIEIIMGHHDCNNEYRLYDYNYLLYALKHEIGHTIGISHTNDRKNLMYNEGYEIGHNKAIDNFNPRNLTIPDHEHLSEFKDYGYVINQARMKINNNDNINLLKVMECFYTPPFLSYDWFYIEFIKILINFSSIDL